MALGVDGQLFKNLKLNTGYLQRHGLAGTTIAVYTKAFGHANGLCQLIEADKHLASTFALSEVRIKPL